MTPIMANSYTIHQGSQNEKPISKNYFHPQNTFYLIDEFSWHFVTFQVVRHPGIAIEKKSRNVPFYGQKFSDFSLFRFFIYNIDATPLPASRRAKVFSL